MTGTHLNDMTVFGPIFVDGALSGSRPAAPTGSTSAPRTRAARWTRPRSTRRGSASGRSRWSRAAVQRADITDLLGRNSRFSHPAVGDLGAQIACVRTGQRRLEAIIAKYGIDTIREAREEIFAQTERLERAAVAALPDGVYRAEGALDNDGVGDGPVLGAPDRRDRGRADDDRPDRHRRRPGRPRSTAARRRRSRPAASPTSC